MKQHWMRFTIRGSIFLAVLAVLLALAVILEWMYFSSRIRDMERYEETLKTDTTKLKTIIGYSGMVLGLPPGEIQKLKKKGLANPGADIVYDLVKNRGFILPSAYLGRDVGFRFKSNVQILSSRWVLADFDDGEMSGKILLEYSVASGGRISWRIVNTYIGRLDEEKSEVQ
jgi:hypothetical protein